MMTDWIDTAGTPGGTLGITNARIPHVLIDGAATALAADGEGMVRAHLMIRDGKIAEVSAVAPVTEAPTLDMEGRQVWPAMVDMHTHLDKGHIWPRATNPDGSHPAAARAVAADRVANWTEADVAARFDFALRCAFAHGTRAIRTHIDSHEPHRIESSWRVFRRMREAWDGRIALQGVFMTMLDAYGRDEIRPHVRMVAETGGLLGGVTKIRTPLGLTVDEMDHCLDRLFGFAATYGLDVDLHVDETLDPDVRTLDAVARAALRNRFAGRITCGHCCNLSMLDEQALERTLTLCREAGIGIVTLPMVNSFLQDRTAARTPRFRGIAPVHELRAADLNVAAASDNCRDPFYAYGDLDLVEVFREYTRIAHLDMPFGDWADSITSMPARMMGIDVGVIRPGAAADLILFRARGMTELLARPQSDRVVLRGGARSRASLPDYSDLDPLFETRLGAA